MKLRELTRFLNGTLPEHHGDDSDEEDRIKQQLLFKD